MKASVREIQRNRNIYFSQAGEDGVIDYVLSKLPNLNRWCVEFGAWDGKHLSNCHHLIRDRGYSAVLIELDKVRHAELEANMSPYGAICLNAEVGFEGEKKLDTILDSTPAPHDFDVLSSDIDGDDYHVWRCLDNYAPKVVIVEINIKDFPGVQRINHPGTPLVWGMSGTSIDSMTTLAHEKGYALISMVGCNAIYVRREYLSHFHEHEPSVRDVFTYEGHASSHLSLAQKLRKFEVKMLSTRLLHKPLQDS